MSWEEGRDERTAELLVEAGRMWSRGALLWAVEPADWAHIREAVDDWCRRNNEIIKCIDPAKVDGWHNVLFGGMVVVPALKDTKPPHPMLAHVQR